MTNKKEIDEWAKKSIPILKEYGYIRDKNTLLLVIVAFVIGVTVSGIFFYGIQNDAFKSDVNQTVNLDPITNISNQYLFAPQNQFAPNYTIQVNIPDNLCG